MALTGAVLIACVNPFTMDTTMPQTPTFNRRLILAERPKGEPTSATLRLETDAVPAPGPGQMLLRTEYLSLDPYMRGRMSDAPSYAAPVAVGAVMEGGTVAQVVTSDVAGFGAGDWVLSFNGWQDYGLSDGTGVTRLDPAMAPLSWALGILGMPGFTAWAGLTQIGMPKPGETVCVAAATGPVGATVGQIAKLMGCTVVGVAGGADKCAHAVNVLGFDACIDHKSKDFAAQLQTAAPKGIDVYFENVGGAVFDAVLPLLNKGARVPVCGLVSQYNATSLPAGPDRLSLLMSQILRKQMTVRGFIIFQDFGHVYPEFAKAMGAWLKSGKMHYVEDMVEGLEAAPQAFIGMLRGENFGKRVIHVGQHAQTAPHAK